ncbi:MAG: putative bifunctional diguanylate cyclase/phosphodiesterase, partial [Pollutimonas bauzanensis]
LEVERIAPGLAVLILAVDEAGRLRPLAAPSLPAAHAQSLDGLAAGPQAGPWGLAARRAEAVLAQDSAALPLRQRHASLAWPAEMGACWAIPITAPDGKVLGVFTIYSGEPRGPDALHRKIAAISVQVCALMLERDRARAHIHELAFYDPLTRLPNRSMLQMMAGPLLDEARAGQQPAALVLIDLDHFKHINDAQGYAAGDALLRDLARRLQACVRENDIVARLVGDEFVILVPCCGADQAVQLIRRLSSEILSLASLDTGLSQHVEASFGVAIFPADGDSLDMLLHHADMAMSQAKANGRNGYCFFSAEINQAVQERAVLEASLRLALREDGLELHYQPQLDIGERRLVGVEALLRWNHPTLGAVSPLRIVALAEAAGLIGELGHWCVSRACAQMAQWEGAGLRVPRVSVNLTAANFKEAELPAFLSRILREHGLAPRRLTLELTEHGMLEHGPVVRRTIAAIHDHGISLSLDDFGTGYSSLGYLHRLPFDEIKLDKSFIQDLEHNEAARALTTSVLRIGEMLCMRVVAEGVETEFQRRFLAERGQPIIQGYLFARPMGAAQLQQWLADRRRR